jgi:hypothetical protein
MDSLGNSPDHKTLNHFGFQQFQDPDAGFFSSRCTVSRATDGGFQSGDAACRVFGVLLSFSFDRNVCDGNEAPARHTSRIGLRGSQPGAL